MRVLYYNKDFSEYYLISQDRKDSTIDSPGYIQKGSTEKKRKRREGGDAYEDYIATESSYAEVSSNQSRFPIPVRSRTPI